MINFESLRPLIQESLERKLKSMSSRFSLIEGFSSIQVGPSIEKEPVIGGPVILAVNLVENDTGQIHQFALKALLTELDI